MSVNVYDTWGAKTVAESAAGAVFVEPPSGNDVSNETKAALTQSAAAFVAVGEGVATTQIIAAAAETLNTGNLAAVEVDFRAQLMELLCDTSGMGGSDPEANAARAAALAAHLSGAGMPRQRAGAAAVTAVP